VAAKTNFIVLIGGPGKFEPCDREHDLTWTNYIVPIQVAMQDKQLGLGPNEDIHWWVYAPAYRERWGDDTADIANKKLPAGPELLDSRRAAIARVKATGANDYLERISHSATTLNAAFKPLEAPDDFWKRLQELPNKSVSRIWYFGHASPEGFMLKLSHSSTCTPQANQADMILTSKLAINSGLISSKLATDGKTSKFYGCYTKGFAEQWNTRFGAAAEGSISKIDFGVTDRPSSIRDVLPRLEQSTATTGWTSFPAKRP